MTAEIIRRARAKPDSLAPKSFTTNESHVFIPPFPSLKRASSGHNDTLSQGQTDAAGGNACFLFPILNQQGICL